MDTNFYFQNQNNINGNNYINQNNYNNNLTQYNLDELNNQINLIQNFFLSNNLLQNVP